MNTHNYDIEDRIIKLANYIVDTKSTVRGAAKEFGVSKSTVHKDMVSRLNKIDKRLYREVRSVLDENKKERHIRGRSCNQRKI